MWKVILIRASIMKGGRKLSLLLYFKGCELYLYLISYDYFKKVLFFL